MKTYEGVDFLEIDDLFSDEQKQIRQSVRSFVESKFLPVVAGHYRAGTFPMELASEIGEMGLLGCTIEGYGCAGMSGTDYGIIMEELERGDSGIRSFASVQSSLCMYPISAFGTEEQKQKYLPDMAKAKVIGCFGLTEPDFGSNPGGMLTTAKKTDSGYVLNGTKRWITNGSIADLAIVWAKLDGKVHGFIVPTKAEGFIPKDIPGKLSLRASVTSEFIMEDCEIPEDCILPEAKGLKAALMCLNQARYGIVWGVIGAAKACYQEALDFAMERDSFSGKIAHKQLVQAKLTWMLTEITKAQLLAWRLGQLKDQNKLQHYQISMGKMNNVGRALEIARMARDILGANGVSDEYQSMRHMCNLESVNTYEGTYDIHSLIVGERITGQAAF